MRENNQAAKKTWVYTYDGGGNLLTRKEYAYTTGTLGSVKATCTYGYDDASWKDLLTTYNGKTLTYNSLGYVKSDGTWSYTWEHGKHLKSMTGDGKTVSFTYDADGNRVKKTVNGEDTEYYYQGERLIEVKQGSSWLHYNYDSVGPVSAKYVDTIYYFLRNAQGDVVGIVDSWGKEVVRYRYDAWGNLLEMSGDMADTLGKLNVLRYRGYCYDDETGLYYLKARYYNPAWGRFISADSPVIPTISPESATWDKNLFAYCDNNPVTRKDDGGEFWHVIAGAIIGGLGNAVMTAISGGDAASIAVSFATGALAGGLTAAGIPFGASIAVNAFCGAAESVFNDLHNRKGEKYSAGEIVGHAVLNAGTAALFTYVAGPSEGKEMNRLYKEAKAGEKFMKTVGTSPTGNRAAKQAIGKYYTELGRFIIRESKDALIYFPVSRVGSQLTRFATDVVRGGIM